MTSIRNRSADEGEVLFDVFENYSLALSRSRAESGARDDARPAKAIAAAAVALLGSALIVAWRNAGRKAA